MKKVVLLIALVACGFGANAQFQASRLTFSGGLGLQFGDYTVVNIAPQVGYNFTDYFNAGAGINYTYYKEEYNNNDKQTNSYFGMNLYGKLYPIPYVVLMVQPEINRMWRTYKSSTGIESKTNKVIPSVLIGGGVRLGPMQLMIQYDVAGDKHSPYGDNIFYSVGYTFSL